MENQLSNRKHLHNMKRPYVRNAKSKGLADLLDTLFEGDEMDNEEEPAIIVEDDHDSTPSVLKQILEAFLANLQKLTSKEAVDKVSLFSLLLAVVSVLLADGRGLLHQSEPTALPQTSRSSAVQRASNPHRSAACILSVGGRSQPRHARCRIRSG